MGVWGTSSPEQLHYMVLKHQDTANHFSQAKRATLNRYVQHVLARNNFSVQKISISQSVPPIWREKAMENAARIRNNFSKHKVDTVINADETFLPFHPFGQRLIAPTGIKRVRTAVQVDNERWGGDCYDLM